MRQARQIMAALCAALAVVALWRLLAAGMAQLPPPRRADPAEPALWAFGLERPAVPSDLLEQVIAGALEGKVNRVASLFSDQGAGAAFAGRWYGALPKGTVRVAGADHANASAEAGHLTPVQVWVEGTDRVSLLAGQFRVVQSPAGIALAEADLEPAALRVAAWSEAERLIGRSGLARSTRPFLGHFRFREGDRRWAVEARTGAVEEE